MKIGVWGKGKTGGEVIKILEEEKNPPFIIFDSKNPPSLEKLTQLDALVCFVPGPIFVEYRDLLIESGISVVTGATGMNWPDDFSKKLEEKKITWVWGSNFAIGMNIVLEMIKLLSRGSDLFSDASFKMHEVHHTKKLDAPSGTALTWKNVLGRPVEITHERVGDVIGDHEIVLETAYERISLKHESLSRKIFASGALWAMNKILTSQLSFGLHDIKDLTRKEVL